MKRRPAGDDDVQLLVAVLLGVLLDHALARLVGRVGVDAERADVEAPPNRPPGQALAVDRERLQLVDVRDRRTAHVCLLSSSSTTGSTRSTPSTRSSRFSLPAHAVKARAELALVAEPREPLSQLVRERLVDVEPLLRGVLPKIAWCRT